MEIYEAAEDYSRVIFYDKIKEVQIRLTVNTFLDIEYLSLRKYYLDFDEEWKPSKEGVTFPIDFANSKELFIGLLDILSLAEAKESLKEHFADIINDLEHTGTSK